MSINGPAGAGVPTTGFVPAQREHLADETRNSRGTANFADMLREAEARSSKTGMQTAAVASQPAQSSKHYASEVKIGDDAVAFASRPLVAPAAVETSSRSSPPPPSFKRTDPEIAGPQSNALARAFDELSITPSPDGFTAKSFGVLAPKPGLANISGAAGGAAEASPNLPLQGSPKSANPNTASPAALLRSPSQADRSTVADAISRPVSAQSLIHQQSSNPVFALLIPGQSEYRLAIRGQRLNDGERDQLIHDMQLTLAQLGLPMQPVRVMMPEPGA